MHATDWTRATPIAVADLPPVVTEYLAAHTVRDLDVVTAAFTADGAVTDEGRTYHGHDAIRTWLGRAAGEYTYTSRTAGAGRVDAGHVVVVQHLEGDFPGGVVDLNFRFALRGDMIAELVIEP